LTTQHIAIDFALPGHHKILPEYSNSEAHLREQLHVELDAPPIACDVRRTSQPSDLGFV
jgi:hypothetical protein